MSESELLKAHQAAIDAWYENWLREARAHIHRVFDKKAKAAEAGTHK